MQAVLCSIKVPQLNNPPLSVTKTLKEFSHEIFTSSNFKKNECEHYLNVEHKTKEEIA
jgi:hypothetical protein